LANDVIQNCRRKNAKVFQDTFKNCLVEAVTLVRNDAIKSNIERIFDVWADRSVYDKEFIVKLHAALYQNASSKLALPPSPPKETTLATTSQKTPTQNNKASPLIDALSSSSHSIYASNSKHDLEQIIAEFQPKKLCETITALQTEINETSIYKTSVEATRLLDISFEHIKQYRGM
jgi:hypothetical protein